MVLLFNEYRTIDNLLSIKTTAIVIGEIFNFNTKSPICIIDETYKLIKDLTITPDCINNKTNRDLVFMNKEHFFNVCKTATYTDFLTKYTFIIKNVPINCISDIPEYDCSIIINNNTISKYGIECVKKYSRYELFLTKPKYYIYTLLNRLVSINITVLNNINNSYNFLYITSNLKYNKMKNNANICVYEYTPYLIIDDILQDTILIYDDDIHILDIMNVFKGQSIMNIDYARVIN
tara:strand:+ start:205 stop:909 length:705 start_codon:yes stop_codon:yes gene_type:complete